MSGADEPWRLCIDFGTATSKASLCANRSVGGIKDRIAPLQIGRAAGDGDPYLVQSYLLFDEARIYFSSRALERACYENAATDPLHSFKTFLAAGDLAQAINLRLRRNVDQHCEFTQRDALVLYTAFLLQLIDGAVGAEGLAGADAPRRYAYPLWRPGDDANRLITCLFDEAAALKASLGASITDIEGLDRNVARQALAAARQAPGNARLEGGVFEALAAAEAHFAFADRHPDYVLVFDMGAGTVDITSFSKTGGGDGDRAMRELEGARQTAGLACDAIDKILVGSLFEHAAKRIRVGAHKQLWRHLAKRGRKLKERLFTDGVCETEFEGKRLSFELNVFVRDREFQRFRKALQNLYTRALDRLAQQAGPRADIGIVLAGGGAALPFVQEMAQKTKPTANNARRIMVEPLSPAWADGLSPVLRTHWPQMSISIGGAAAVLPATDRAAA